ncbi:MAG: TusE/DsrC/DsvC family sulfur relay protein [Pedobacter sp.]|nr:TusE/DsrC/DsvC family sulfur relay protein [Pedobacter sp.]
MSAGDDRFDAEGYLRDRRTWTEELATEIAARDNIQLTPAHWEILQAIRRFYTQYEMSPATRPLLKYLGQELGAEKAGSIYVMQLFPGTPAKTIARIAGLPKPANCI